MLHSSYYLNRKYYEADVLISLPTLKNHGSACITGSLKNVWIGATPGNIYGRTAENPHRGDMVNHASTDLHRCIHDWNLCKPIDFVIMDGLNGFQNEPGTDMTILFFNGGYILLFPSLIIIIFSLLIFAGYIILTKIEDDYLVSTLDFYHDYAKNVKFRLFPGIW